MGRGIVKNLLAVVVALVLTVGVVVVLSAATKLAPDAAEQYSRQVRRVETQVEELSAPAHAQESVTFLEAAGGFVLILVVSAAGAMLLLRNMRKNSASRMGRAYQPRKDMAHLAAPAPRPARPVRRVRRV